MPIYEFRCAACGERFEALVDAGTEAEPCRHCGADGAGRILSAPAPKMSLVKGPGAMGKQEGRNAALHRKAKSDFKEKRAKAREKRAPGKPAGGGG